MVADLLAKHVVSCGVNDYVWNLEGSLASLLYLDLYELCIKENTIINRIEHSFLLLKKASG